MKEIAGFLLAVGCTAFFHGGFGIGQDAGSEKPKAKAEAPLTAATVVRVSESRAQNEGRDPSGSTSVKIRFEPPFENAEVIRVVLTRATDSLGNDLIDPKRATKETAGQIQFDPSDRYEARVSLRLAKRTATSIAEIAGTVVFHDPEAAEKPIVIDDYQKQAGEFVSVEALEAAGISVAYLDEATFDEKGSKLLMRQVLGEFGLDEVDEDLTKASTAPFKILLQAEGQSLFVIRDTEKKLVKFEGLDSADAVVGTGIESVKGLWLINSMGSDQQLAKIRVHLRSKEAEVSRQFVISEVHLP